MPGTIGVVGAGTMGAGIAQVALEAGHRVVITDIDPATCERGRDRVRSGLERRARRIEVEPGEVADWVDVRMTRLDAVAHLADVVAHDPVLVIEAAIEDLAAKQALFRELDSATSTDTILASNTSALSVARIAAVTGHPERVLGLHFFNPAPVMPLVEVVVGPATDRAAAQVAFDLMATWGKTAVRCADTPGFIVNRVNRPFTLEGLAILEAGEATIAGIDGAVRADGFPMGPFELMDLVGIDVNLAAARGVFEGFTVLGDRLADRFRPSPIQERLVAGGRLGRKTGAGFYAYDEKGTALGPASEFAERAPRVGIDAAGIARRIVLAIVAEAYRAVDDGTASAADIDLAMRLGAGHRTGPFERARQLGGAESVVQELRGIVGGGPRFEPAAGLVSGTRR